MKLLFDQNLSPKLAEYFKDTFTGSKHVQEIGLDASDDIFVWEYAKSYDFTIVTKDSDFNNLISLFGFPPKVIWLRKGNCSTKLIKEIIQGHFDLITGFINDSENGILSIF
jgi:predicted nuclease of predicted toxin-antitoxin system